MVRRQVAEEVDGVLGDFHAHVESCRSMPERVATEMK